MILPLCTHACLWRRPGWPLLQERAPTEYDIRSGVTLEG